MTTIRVGENNSGCDFHLCPGENLFTGERPFVEQFGTANSLEIDLLNLASGIFAADLIVARNEREYFIRTIEVTVEVVNLQAFRRIAPLLTEALFTVSRDNWTFKFVSKKGEAVSELEWKNQVGSVLLFSGGLDSMSAASELLTRADAEVVLVSHNSHANTAVDNCQRNVHSALEEYFKRAVEHIHIKVYGRNKGSFLFPVERENTQRTRSFMFLSIAALVTRRSGLNKLLYMAENGQFAIHLPLNQARVSAFSTHTADPHFVRCVESLFRLLLDNEEFEISNPFLYKTKAEVVALLPQQLRPKAANSASCWMISRIADNKHCGICIPCISRRISLEFNGLEFDEYDRDLFSENIGSLPDDDTGKRNLIDYLEFVTRFKDVGDSAKMGLLLEFPELFNSAIDQEKALEMYGRVSSQSFDVLKKYPMIVSVL